MNEINKSLYTKTAYSKAFKTSRPTIDRKIKQGLLRTLTINGGTLIKVA